MANKTAPIQIHNSPHGIRLRIPWRIHLKAWEQYAKGNHGQSAERLAERGGFGLTELIYLLAGENPYRVPDDDPEMLSNFFNEWPEQARKP